MRLLSTQGLNQHFVDVYSRLDGVGRLDFKMNPSGRSSARKLEIDLFIPGFEDPSEFSDEVQFRYQEWWHQSSLGWLKVRYDYDYFSLLDYSRRGYHLHPLKSKSSVPHQICIRSDGSGTGYHYEALEVDLLEVHKEFEVLYESNTPIDCRYLKRID